MSAESAGAPHPHGVVQHGGDPMVFEISGLDCQNEVRQLKDVLSRVVGDQALSFDTTHGLMTVAAGVAPSAEEIARLVAVTGMRATLRSSSPGEADSPMPLRFRVVGLDCVNEVRQLKAMLVPLVGAEDKLAFDTKTGTMEITAAVEIAAVERAVATTGMTATPIDAGTVAPVAALPESFSLDAEPASAEAGTTPKLENVGSLFRIHGMDCGEEVAALKREVGPVVGGEHKLGFDLLNGRMSVTDELAPPVIDAVVKAVTRTGMQAEVWQQGATTDAGVADERRRRLQSYLTAGSGVFAALGFAVHAQAVGGVVAAFQAGEHGAGVTPWPAVVLYTLSVLCAIRYVGPKALLAARRLRPDMNLLMVVAVLGAIGIGAWFEAATVSFFFALALALEAWSLGRARRAVAALMDLAPPTARTMGANGEAVEVPVQDVTVGTRIAIRPGEKIPLDGEVVAGSSEVNQAPITGESVPVECSAGTTVFAGTINGDGALDVIVTKGAQDTTLAHIIRMVGTAQSRRAPSEQWVERFARVYTPAVMLLAALVLLVPPLLLQGAWDVWFYRALVMLVIACPCALVISTPVSIVAALAGAAKQGVLVKGGLHLETPARLVAVAMDKTGTLTEGRPRVTALVTTSARTEAEVLQVAAALEARSEHPIARAIVDRARERGMTVTAADDVQAVQGRGVVGRFQNGDMWLGSARYVEERGLAAPALARQVQELTGVGRTIVAVGDQSEVWGLIALADAVRPEARGIVQQLHAAGIERVVMLTGDNRATAQAIAGQTGVDEVRAELLPADKVTAIEDLVRLHGTVAMIGDGVNDAPAMARASLGVAMGAIGSDAAIETADIALMSDDLSKLPWLIRHSRATLGIIHQNVAFSIAVKLIFMILTFVGFASLWGAIAADVGASLLVVLNGLRLLNRDQGGTTQPPTSTRPVVSTPGVAHAGA